MPELQNSKAQPRATIKETRESMRGVLRNYMGRKLWKPSKQIEFYVC